MSLDAAYWSEQGQPSETRLERLPQYARAWIETLKQRAMYWHARSTGTEFVPRIRGQEPSAEQVADLPVWAQEWIRTLLFEVRWWRDQCRPASTIKQGSLF